MTGDEFHATHGTSENSVDESHVPAVALDSREDSEGSESRQGSPVGRRIVLGMLGLGAVGVLVGRQAQEAITSTVSATVPGLGSIVPAAGGFRIYTVTGGYPAMDPADYRLDVTGNVTTPLSLTMADLADLPQTSMTKDFQCVTGWRVDNVLWSGVLLSDVLAAAGASTTSSALRFFSFDGAYTESLTMEQAIRDDVLVATFAFLGLSVAHL